MAESHIEIENTRDSVDKKSQEDFEHEKKILMQKVLRVTQSKGIKHLSLISGVSIRNINRVHSQCGNITLMTWCKLNAATMSYSPEINHEYQNRK